MEKFGINTNSMDEKWVLSQHLELQKMLLDETYAFIIYSYLFDYVLKN